MQVMTMSETENVRGGGPGLVLGLGLLLVFGLGAALFSGRLS